MSELIRNNEDGRIRASSLDEKPSEKTVAPITNIFGETTFPSLQEIRRDPEHYIKDLKPPPSDRKD